MNRTDYAAAAITAYALWVLTAVTGPGWLVIAYFCAVAYYCARWAHLYRRDRIARIQQRQRRRGWGGTI